VVAWWGVVGTEWAVKCGALVSSEVERVAVFQSVKTRSCCSFPATA